MGVLNKETILQLSDRQDAHCISIFIPTHRKGLEVNEGYDRIRLKNQIQQIRAELQSRALNHSEVEALLLPLEELLGNTQFWRHQSEGLALFRSQNYFDYFHSPVPFEEQYQVANRFLINPLLPFVQPASPYYLLRFGKKGVSLFKADRYSIAEVDINEGFPHSIEEVTQYYDFEEELQGRSASGGGVAAMHRSDDMDNKHKDHLLADYFRLIDQGIKNKMGTENAPLLLASVEYYQPIYRQVNSYPFLHASGLTGNFDHTQPEELHRMANEKLGDHFVATQQQRVNQYQNNSGTDLTSTDLRQILDAAVTGRIETLFIREDAQVWGRFDEEQLTATIQGDSRQDNDPLIDRAALLTLRNGGEVYVMEDVNLLANEQPVMVSAMFRY